MLLGTVIGWLLALLFNERPPTLTHAPSGHYGGVEWVLDPDGELLASRPVAVERTLDVRHRTLRSRVHRAPSRGNLACVSTSEMSVVATTLAPHALEARAAHDDGTRSSLTEEVKAGVLVTREIVRDALGRVLEIHIVNMTPIDEAELRARAISSRTCE